MVTKDDKKLAEIQIIASGMFTLGGILIAIGLTYMALFSVNSKNHFLILSMFASMIGLTIIAITVIVSKKEMAKIKTTDDESP